MEFDAASQHRSNMLENLHMLKHCACAVFSMIPMSDVSIFVCFFYNVRCSTALNNSLGLWSDFHSVLPPKINEKCIQNPWTNAQKSFQNGCKIWLPLGIAFLSILDDFRPPSWDHFRLFFAKNGATLIAPFASGALCDEVEPTGYPPLPPRLSFGSKSLPKVTKMEPKLPQYAP